MIALRQKLRASKIYRQLQPHFDSVFYAAQSPDVVEAGIDPLTHYLRDGWIEGRDPTRDFSTLYYLEANPDVARAEINPFWHYIRSGKAEGRLPKSPVKPPPSERDILQHVFDARFYGAQFPEGHAPSDPLGHYISAGWREGRDPTSWFSTTFYLDQNPDVRAADINPFLHYLRDGIHETRLALPAPQKGGHYEAQDHATQAGPLFEEFDPEIAQGRTPLAKVLAYYLPQFHAIPENDEYWGEGFTEWRNVARGQPRFEGHIQPRIPRDLGHYCLDDPEIMRRQIDMARAAGLHGFCFYYYSFGGRRVLEKPIENMLKDPTLDFPFTLMWANENWTRTWDGFDAEILLEQDYDPAKNKALIADLARHFDDPRYIRVEGRPLFFIYRPGQVPNAAVTITKWRRLFESEHNMQPLMLMVQGFGDHNPDLFGLDGAIEFPPHKICQDMENIAPALDLLDSNFEGHVIGYDDVVARSAAVPVPDFPLIRTTTPYWDNEARRPGRGMMMQGSTPEKFGAWLKQTVAFARENPLLGESFVAVNAWNEWAEAAYLEPDVHYGAAYLNALSRAVHGVPMLSKSTPGKVVIVGHDANRHGAQILVANLARVMSQQFGLEVVILLCAPAPWLQNTTHFVKLMCSAAIRTKQARRLLILPNAASPGRL